MTTTTWESRPELPDGAGPPPAPEPEGERRWMAWTAPLALITALIVATVGGLIATIVHAATSGAGLDDDTPPGVLLVATLVQDLGFIGAAILFAKMTGPVWAAQFGLRRTRFWPAVGWIAVLYFTFLLFSGLWQQIVEIPEDDAILDDLGVDQNTALLVGGLLIVCIAAPVVEEFFFRGYFYAALRNWRGIWPAAILTGIVFGAIHLGGSPAGALVPLGVLGLGLCLLYEKTGSLYPPIAVHAINNAIAFGVLNDWTWEIALLVPGATAISLGLGALAARRWPPPALRGPAVPAGAPPAP